MTDPKETQRNFNLGVLNGLFFVVGETLIDPTLVMAAFISHLTHSELWVGLVVPILDYTWFLPQLWVSGHLQSQPRKMPLYQLTAMVRAGSWVALTAAIFLIPNENLLLAAFVIMLSIAAIGAGFSGLSFLEIVGKTIPPQQRGLFFAWRLTLAGVVGIGASGVVQWLLGDHSPVTFPNNFGLLFLAATLLFFGGWGSFLQVREPADAQVLPTASFGQQLQRALQILRVDSNYRNFLILRSLLMIAGAGVPFYAIYVQHQLGGSLGMIGIYLATFKAANLLATIFLGRVSARWGYHRLMTVSTGAGILMTGMVLGLVVVAATTGVTGWAAAWWLVPVFIVNGIRESGIGIAGQSLLLEIAPSNERSLYLGFTNTFLGLVLFVTSFSGLLVETVGFAGLFIVTLVAYLLALNSASRLTGESYPAASTPR